MKSDLFKNITEDKMDESYDPRFIKYLASVAIYYCKDEKCSLDYLTNLSKKIISMLRLWLFRVQVI